MMAFKVFVRPGKTFRINLACTKAFNADFDGDEMNVHVAQSPEARAEVQLLSTVENNLISGQTSKMNIVIVQDGVLGSYLMTKKNSRALTRGQFMNALMRTSTIDKYTTRVAEIQATLEATAMRCLRSATTLLSGRGLVSFILPSDFSYKKKNWKRRGRAVAGNRKRSHPLWLSQQSLHWKRARMHSSVHTQRIRIAQMSRLSRRPSIHHKRFS